MFKKNDFITLGKGYDITNTSLIILDRNLHIQYANSYAKMLLNWENENSWMGKQFNDMWKFLGLPTLFGKNKIFSAKLTFIKDFIRIWQLSEVKVGNEIYLFLLDKDVTKEEQIHSALKDTLKEVTGQILLNNISTQEYINEIRNHFESIITQMPGYVYWKDLEFKYLFCNEAASSEILGFSSPKEIIGKTDYDFGWDKKLVDEYRKVDEEIIRTGKPKLGFHEQLILNKGKVIEFLVNKMPLRNNSGNVVGIIGITIDVTLNKQAEQLKIKNMKQKIQIKTERLKTENEKQKVQLEATKKITHCLSQIQNVVQEYRLDILNDKLKNNLL
jgi:PAS domain S-box-containing protein